ncbi:MAG: hypothetical protein JJU06_05750 [Ectothiorhodospiraceae bacterium]|nr:hypothetical protein [Ectothiorhodospiraceae bacterium]MCH8502921.1 hypothetical protein [Ectothiorhodospiraceae bacterium]
MAQTVEHYIGVGVFYLNGRDVGQTSEATITIEENTIELPDSRNPGGGIADSVSRITSVQMELALRDLRPENLALALRGLVRNITAGTVTGEEHSVTAADRLIPLENIEPEDVEVTDGDSTTYEEGTDYRVDASGIYLLEGGAFDAATEEDPMPIEVDYEHGAQRVVEALVEAGLEFEVHFSGVNEARGGAPMVLDVYRFRPSPTESFGLISADDFATLQLTGRVLADPSKGVPGQRSSYMRTRQRAAA